MAPTGTAPSGSSAHELRTHRRPDVLVDDADAVDGTAGVRRHRLRRGGRRARPLGHRRLRARVQRRHEADEVVRSEEHTSELQSLMRISYAVSCSKKQRMEKDTRKITSNAASKKSTRHCRHYITHRKR